MQVTWNKEVRDRLKSEGLSIESYLFLLSVYYDDSIIEATDEEYILLLQVLCILDFVVIHDENGSLVITEKGLELIQDLI